MPNASFLRCLKAQVVEAYGSAIPERPDLVSELAARLDNIDVGHRADSFYAIPAYSIVNVGWWALESIWCLAYCVHVWGKSFRQAMQDGKTAVPLDSTAGSYIGLGLLKWAVENLALQGQKPWLHEDVADFPYDASGEPFDENVRSTERVFLSAVGWILLHELAHILHGHGNNPDVRAEEEEADRTATRWLFDEAPFGTVDDRFTGLATAMLYMWIREDSMAGTDSDHPPVADRIEAAMRDARLHENAWCLCVLASMMETFEQYFGSGQPMGQRVTFDTCREYVEACVRARRSRNSS